MTDTEDTIDYVELAARLGLPACEQSAVLAWTGESADTIWTIAEAERLADVWAADTERITQEV
jgi:hypothetical protein